MLGGPRELSILQPSRGPLKARREDSCKSSRHTAAASPSTSNRWPELRADWTLWTLDEGVRLYRKNKRETLSLGSLW
jgi:hypothetical protein